MRLVPVAELKSGMIVGKSIFGHAGQRLLRQGIAISERYIQHLRHHGIEVVYISTGQEVVPQDVISDDTRIRAISETKKALESVKRGACLEVERIHEVLLEVIDELLQRDDVMINLVDIRSYDEELFSHSVNVAILSVITGIELKLSQAHLKDLALGGLLHDVGLLFCADQEHPVKGKEVLEQNSFLDMSVILAAYQHHERWDGTGFPEGLGGKEISRLARIIAVANRFDMLSANSKYPMEEVIEYIMAMSGVEFDPEAVRAFINCVSFYPVGTRVELNNGSSGFVVKANRGFPTRPVVRVDQNQYGSVGTKTDLNLIEHPTYFIVKRLDEQNSPGEVHDT